MSETPKIEVEMAFLSKAEGGRERPPVLTTPTMYRPHLVVGSGQHLGVIFLTAPEFVDPHQSFVATLGLVYYPDIDYSALVPGAEFTVREGARVVGQGRVIRR